MYRNIHESMYIISFPCFFLPLGIEHWLLGWWTDVRSTPRWSIGPRHHGGVASTTADSFGAVSVPFRSCHLFAAIQGGKVLVSEPLEVWEHHESRYQ